MLKRTFVMACLITFVTLTAQPVMAGVNILAGPSTPSSVGILSETDKIGFLAFCNWVINKNFFRF